MDSAELLQLLGDSRRALHAMRSTGLNPVRARELEQRLEQAENAVADIATMLTRDQAYNAAMHHEGLAEEIAADLDPLSGGAP